MERGQIISLSVGAGIVVVGGVLAWQGLLPGIPALRLSNSPPTPPSATAPAPEPSEQSTNPAKSAPPQNVATTPPAANPAPAASPKPTPAPAQDAKAGPVVPQFDTVRVEPSGDTVVAGHGAPKAKVDLLNADTVLGAADADIGGDFVIVPQPLAPGTYVLALRSTLGQEPSVRSTQTITVNVPAKGQKGLVVALSEPGKPSKILRDPTADADTPPSPAAAATPPAPQPAPSQSAAKGAEPAAAPAAVPPPPAVGGKPTVVIKTAEVDRGGFYAAGMAQPGTHVRIYLNDSPLADVTADAKGEWSLTIGKGMTPGHYVVRADALNAKGKVVARAEVPFDVPVAVAAADQPAAKPADAGSAPPPHAGSAQNDQSASGEANPKPAEENAAKPKSADTQTADSSHAVVAEISTAKVIEGDSLWGISRKTLGEGIRYTLIYKANAKQIRDPDLIYPGQIFVVPH
jgi:nucleoid-associated protein YgaU